MDPGIEADRMVSAETTRKYLMNIAIYSQEFVTSKALFLYRTEMMQSHARYSL